jgi:hypothetical protein
MVLVIQRNKPVPPRGRIKAIALKMEVGDMVVCKPAGKSNGNLYFSALHKILTDLGHKARSERVVSCGSCGKVKDMSIRRSNCDKCGARSTVTVVRTWRTA